MDVKKAIKERREITSFKDTKISMDTYEEILEAGYYAPTGNNLPSREFILVTKRDKLDELTKTTPFMPWLQEAAGAIVVTGCPSVSKYWIQDSSISTGFMWLRATELGIGVGFGAVYHHEDAEESAKREKWVRDVLNIPSDRRIIAILGLGYANHSPKTKTLPPRDKIVYYENL